MQFNSYFYMLCFLPLSILGYFVLNKWHATIAKIFLIIMSVFFYAYGNAKELVWLAISLIVNCMSIVCVKKLSLKKVWMLLAILFNIGMLFYFKYMDFSISILNEIFNKDIALKNIVLPLGISFLTFSQISYIVDTYHGKTNDNSLMDYLLYILYFPKILMGPIVKQELLIPQFHDKNLQKLNADNLTNGIKMFVLGLLKKLVLADTFFKAVNWGFENISVSTSLDFIIVMFAYTMQIYFDFSGYSDMAIGTSMMLNIKLPINFDSPYKAYSIREFWKRWHISLTKFLTEYIYIPLGGNRKTKLNTYMNILIVFIISGIWHGANWTFILWGFFHGLFSIFDRLTDKWRKNIHPAMQWASTFFLVSILWLLFRANNISEWILLLKHMFNFRDMGISDELLATFVNPETEFLMRLFFLSKLNTVIRGLSMIIFFVASFVLLLCAENTYKMKFRNDIISAIGMSILLLFCLTLLGSESVFVYFNF